MSIKHKSTGKTDPDILKCDKSGCSKNNLRSAYLLGGKHYCESHWRELRKIINKKMEDFEIKRRKLLEE